MTMSDGDVEQPGKASDESLIARAGRGGADGEQAFAQLYLRHRDFVLRVARRFAADDEQAVDAAQEAFAYLFRQMRGVRLSGKLTTYLYPIVKNRALEARRTAERERRRIGRWAAERNAADQVVAEARQEADGSLAAAMDALPEPQREVLLMRVVDGMGVEEVATVLGVPPGTVKSRLHHALEALRTRPELRSYWD